MMKRKWHCAFTSHVSKGDLALAKTADEKGMRLANRCVVIAVAAAVFLFFSSSTPSFGTPNGFVSSGLVSTVITWPDGLILDGLTSGWNFGVYKYGGNPQAHGLDLLEGSNDSLGAATFSVYDDPTDGYTLKVLAGLTAGTDLILGGNNIFSFYFRENTSYHTDFHIENVDDHIYKFSDELGGDVLGVSLDPVPIPTSLWLIGSAMFGLVMIRRRVNR